MRFSRWFLDWYCFLLYRLHCAVVEILLVVDFVVLWSQVGCVEEFDMVCRWVVVDNAVVEVLLVVVGNLVVEIWVVVK